MTLSEEAQHALDLIEKGESVFITGHAGTGKSTLLRYFRDITKKNVVVVAPTGLAAIQIGGQTIHSFFQFPPKFIDPKTIRTNRNAELIKKLHTVVIDEVSMLRADLVDGLDKSLRVNRGVDRPFGGAQVVFFGDLFQLPPVVREPELRDYFNAYHGGPYFFMAHVFEDVRLPYLNLTKTYRQENKDFIALLNRIREKQLDPALLKTINSRVRREITPPYITLTSTNDLAFQRNQAFLNRLSGKTSTYEAQVEGKFDPSAYPTEAVLELKPGAQVLMVKNDPEKRWVNGTLGTIRQAGKKVVVEIDGKSHETEPQTWDNIEYELEGEKIKRKVVGSFQQYPLRLAWAITIHKSQGQTFDKVVIDLGSRSFAHGQTYVALSRCRTLEGITLTRPLSRGDIIVDERVYGFTDVFRKAVFDRLAP